MKDDPAISLIRKVRHEISAEFGHDPKKLVAYYMERQRQREAQKAQVCKQVKPKDEA